MSELERIRLSSELSRHSKREFDQLRQQQLLDMARKILATETERLDEILEAGTEDLIMSLANNQLRRAANMVKDNPAAEPILADLVMNFHAKRLRRSTR